MAKIYFNIEADTVAEIKAMFAELAALVPASAVVESTLPTKVQSCSAHEECQEECINDSEETKKRKRRTKAEIEAARAAEAAALVVPVAAVVQEVEPFVLTASPVEEPVRAVEEVVAPAPPVAHVVPAAPSAPVFGMGIPNFTNMPSPQVTVQPMVMPEPVEVQQAPVQATPAGLPSDLLSALGGIKF